MCKAKAACTTDASAGILIAQKEVMQVFKVQMIGDFAELARLGNEIEATGDEASSCSSREDI
jgi:hypothetical protein